MSNFVSLNRPGDFHISSRRTGAYLHDGSQVTGDHAVVLGTGVETIVIEGTRAELTEFAQRILAAAAA